MLRDHKNNKKSIWPIMLVAMAWLVQPNANAQSDAQILDTLRSCQEVIEMSARLACYDRVLPPTAERNADRNTQTGNGNNNGNGAVVNNEPLPRLNVPRSNRQEAPAPAEQAQSSREAEPAVSGREPQAQRGPVARIVEVERPSLSSFRLTAEDGRVFSQSSSVTIPRFPEPPFDVQIDTGLFGATYLIVPGNNQRIRVAVEN